MKLFVQLTKVDVEKREVWGRATQEIRDKSGEVFDYETSKPNFEKWSSEIEKASDGKSLGNVRAMHGKVAAGKLIALEFNDAEKAIDVGAKIVDEAEWQKCQEGVYTGFSIGGSYARKWTDTEGNKRFTADPSEISVVDNPCVGTAHFSMVKADGVVEEKAFAPHIRTIEVPDGVTDEQVEMVKALLADPSKLEKGGAKYSKATKAAIATVHKLIKDADMGMAAMGYDAMDNDGDEPNEDSPFVTETRDNTKKAAEAELQKLAAEKDEALSKLNAEKDALYAELQKLKNEPLPSKGVLNGVPNNLVAVSKGQEDGGTEDETLAKKIDAMPEGEDKALELIKLAHRAPAVSRF